MGLAEIFEPIGEALKENCRFVGPERKDDNTAPPWICWNPIGSRLTEPKQVRGDAAGADPIYTRQWAIQVDVWGASLTATEELVDRFLAVAFEKLSRHSLGYQPQQEVWNPGGVTARGAECVLTIFIARPVLRTPARLISPIAIATATGLDASAERIAVTVTEP